MTTSKQMQDVIEKLEREINQEERDIKTKKQILQHMKNIEFEEDIVQEDNRKLLKG